MRAPRMMRLSTGEEMTEVEWQCRASWFHAEVVNWWTDPANEGRQKTVTHSYIAAMQRDPRLD